MIMKVLLVIGVIAIVYFMFIKKKPLEVKKTEAKKKPKEDKTQANDLVACNSCGIYCELSDAILSNAKYYCSDECVAKAK